MSTSATAVAALSAEQAENRRRSPRRPYVIEAWISSPTATDPQDRKEAVAVNLSRHGICFDMQEPLPVGCFYTIEVGMGEQRLIAEIRVINCQQQSNRTYSIGAAFC